MSWYFGRDWCRGDSWVFYLYFRRAINPKPGEYRFDAFLEIVFSPLLTIEQREDGIMYPWRSPIRFRLWNYQPVE